MRIEGTEALPTLTWRVRILMAEREIRTVTALQHLLRDVGVVVSTQYLNRVVSKAPERINVVLLQGLAQVLGCDVGDLLRRTDPLAAPVAPPPAKAPPKRERRLRSQAIRPVGDARTQFGAIDPIDPERRPRKSGDTS